jgi:outer membrane lipoprotein SlyB
MKSLRHLIAGVIATLAVLFLVPGRAQAAMDLWIDAVDIEQVAGLGMGTELHFSMYGSPGCAATLQIDGARHGLILGETQAGVYEGTYTVREFDQIRPDSRVTAQLQRDDRIAHSTLPEPLVLGADITLARTPQPLPAAVEPVPAPECVDCGVVESIRAIEAKGSAGPVGTLAGGLIGAVLGNQFGKGDGRTAATVLGAIGGAVAGREIERQQQRRTYYEVVVRLPHGGVQTSSYSSVPPFRVGDRVRLASGGALRRY